MKYMIELMVLAGVLVQMAGCGGGGSSSDGDDGSCGPVIDISENAEVDGRLEKGDCTVNTLFPGANDNSFADEYRVTTPIGGTLEITMRSTSMDTYVAIADTTVSCFGGCDPIIILGFDDDSGGPAITDSFLSIPLAAGTYIIYANSLERETGNYHLETIFL
jgi:hypothetical protein